MTSSATEILEARARGIEITEDALSVDLVDGRTIIIPLAWFPRLWHGNMDECRRFEILGDGAYLHWPDLDEDLCVSDLLAGRRSGESASSLKKWLEMRTASRRSG